MPTKKDLIQQCKDAGIGAGGSVTDLKERLEAHWKYEEALLADPEDVCDAIPVSQAIVGDEDDMKKDGRYAFERTLADRDDPLEVSQARGRFYVGNRRGITLGELLSELCEKDLIKDAKLASLSAKIASLSSKVAGHDEEIASLSAKVAVHDEEMALMKRESSDYRRIRNRFISTYVRDKLGNHTPEDEIIIHQGNSTAHRGDASMDALLYDEDGAGRDDAYAFELLYGLHPSDVKKLTRKETLEVLNLHASVQANKAREGSDEFYQKFQNFRDALKWSKLNEDYLRSENATKTAYEALRDCEQLYKPLPPPAEPMDH